MSNAATTSFHGADHEQASMLFSYLLEHTPDRIYFKDEQSRFTAISKAMVELFRVKDPADILGKTDFDFFTPEHAQPAFDDEREVMRTGRSIAGKIEKETLPDGRIGWALTTKMPLCDGNGRIIGTCGISKDITALVTLENALENSNTELSRKKEELESTLEDLKRTHEALKAAQNQLIEAEKVQSIGRLSAGVAHEIRNPLNILNMGIAYLAGLSALARDSASMGILDEMKAAIKRADAVISTLMETDFSKLELKSTDLPEMIDWALETVEDKLASHGIDVVKQIEPALPLLQLDREKFVKVLSGLFLNAIESMGAEGTLTVRAETCQLAEAEEERLPGGRGGRQFRAGERVLIIEIEDTGPGIPQEALAKIFDPFFTTKETGKGMGLGLTLCRKIIELHHGTIEVANKEGGGARVRIRLKMSND